MNVKCENILIILLLKYGFTKSICIFILSFYKIIEIDDDINAIICYKHI